MSLVGIRVVFGLSPDVRLSPESNLDSGRRQRSPPIPTQKPTSLISALWHIADKVDVRYLVVVARVVLRGHAFFKNRYAYRIKSGTGFFAVMRYCTITVVPTATRSYRSLISSLVRRKQPDDTAWPMLSGSFEPWMR